MKNILVIFGGISQEHDISVITGVFTLNSIDNSLYNAIPIYITKDGKWVSSEKLNNIAFYKNFNSKLVNQVTLINGDNSLYILKKNKLKAMGVISGAINCIHGRNGEDGSLFGCLRMSKIPLVAPNMFCSAMAMDKTIAKKVLKAIDIPTVDGITIPRKSFFREKENCMLEVVKKLTLPVIVKPVSSGSSIGISIAHNYVELENALVLAYKFDEKALIEKYVSFSVDINCAAYRKNNEVVVSDCEKPVSINEILTFNDKYNGSKNGTEREFPAKLNKKISETIKSFTKKIYEEFEFDGVVRIDYLVKDEEVYLNEINCVPGSLAYYLFCKNVTEFKSMLNELLEACFLKNLSYSACSFEFESNVLNGDFKSLKK